MDDDNEDELDDIIDQIEAKEEAIEAGVPTPSFRATWHEGRLLITPYHAGLVSKGPILTLLSDREEELLIADLSATEGSDPDGLRGWELTIEVHTPDPPSEAAREALLAWATEVGYRRVWLPDGVVDLEQGEVRGAAQVRCGTCGQLWRADGHEFWSWVTRKRSFPTWCELCGGDLGVWEVEHPSFGAEALAELESLQALE